MWLTGALMVGLLGLVGLAGVTVFVAAQGLGGAGDWAGVLSLSLAGAVALLSLVMWMLRRAGDRSPSDEPSAVRLRRAVRVQWSAELGVRRLMQPRPLRLRWHPTTRPVAAADAAGGRGRSLRGALADRDQDAWGSARGLVEAFRTDSRRQLVVLGAPGAGKSTLALLFTIAALDRCGSDDPVPVLLSVAGWHPVEPIENWITRRVAEDHPAVAGLGKAAHAAVRRLLDDRMILPMLDGLDELPGPLLGAAVAELDRAAGCGLPMVVTCRHAEFEQAVTDGGTLSNAAVIEIAPVCAVDAARYLTEREVAGSTRWRPVLDGLRDDPTGPAATVLSTPLMIAVARRVYQQPDSDPVQLTEFATAAELERHLLARFLSAAFPESHDNAREQRWLTFLALHLRDTVREPDLRWWRLARALPDGALATTVAVMLTVFGALLGLTGGLFGSAVGSVAGLFAGVLCGRHTARAVLGRRQARRRRIPALMIAAGHALGDLAVAHAVVAAVTSMVVTAALLVWNRVDPARGATTNTMVLIVFDDVRAAPDAMLFYLVYGVMFVAVLFGVGGGGAGEPRRRALRARRLLPSLGLGAAVGVAVGLVTVPLQGGLLMALILVPIVGILVGLGRWLTGAPAEENAASPESVLRSDRAVLLVTVCVITTGITAILTAVLALLDASTVTQTVVIGVTVAVLVAFGTGAPWLSYTLARFRLAATGDLPWRPMRLLRQAHAVGVLRQAGPAYQFRHDLLRTHLADHGPRPVRRLARVRRLFPVRGPRWLRPATLATAIALLPITVAVLPHAHAATLRGHSDLVFYLEYCPDGTLVSGAYDGTVRLWRPGGHSAVRTIRATALRNNTFGIALSPDGSTVVADVTGWDYADNIVRTRALALWDTRSGRRHTIDVPAVGHQTTHRMALGPDGSTLAFTDVDAVHILDPDTGRQRGTIAAPYVNLLAYQPGGPLLVTAGPQGLELWDTTTGRRQRTLTDADVDALAFSRDGSTLVTIEYDHSHGFTLRQWNVATGRPQWRVNANNPVPGTVTVDADGSTIITGESDGVVRFRDFRTGRPRANLGVDLNPVVTMALNADGSVLAVGSYTGPIRLWNLPASGNDRAGR